MKLAAKSLLFLIALAATTALAQTIPIGTFKHIIIIVQENRTPDNLFGSAPSGTKCGIEDPFEPGVDIENGGYAYVPISRTLRVRELICNTSQPMNNGPIFDPGHFYADWTSDYNSGNMDGFCHEYTDSMANPPCPSYSFVQKSDVQPYFAIATTYGFANYVFQTNEGPSFEAHQFLFTGTSAPVAPSDPRKDYHWDFAKDNAGFNDSGCPYTGTTPSWINPDKTFDSPDPLNSECYTHDSLVTSSTCTNYDCDKNVTWRFYAPNKGVIWDAPAAIPEVCYGENDTKYAGKNACGSVNGGGEWKHMSFYTGKLQGAPIFNDINTCQLQQISWVIPDYAWSDHPQFDGTVSPPYGPSWVGDIVDAIGNSYNGSNQNCDYWGYPAHSGITPEPTAIFVVWDDWGGFYDHVQPPNVWTGSYLGNYNWSCPAPNAWGCGYTYGFRVPLLVVSEYTGTLSNGQYSSYISGPCGGTGQPSCPNTTQIYQHDFGSILRYTEYNFSLPFIDQSGDNGYADRNALDAVNGNIPLSDFFPLWTGQGSTGRPFVNIPTPYGADFFQSYYTAYSATPTGPDTE
jgi:phospholipase C